MELINKTIYECFAERVSKTPDKTFIKNNEGIFTWEYVNNITSKMAGALIEQGLKSGEKVGIIGLNSPSWIISFIALQKVGAVAVLINSCYKEKELINCIEIADIKYLFYTGFSENDSISTVVKNLRKNIKMKNLKTFNIEKTYQEWEKFVQRSKLKFDMEVNNSKSKDLSCILFTSGTTNDCKGVMLSHYSLVNNAREVVKQMRWNEKDSMCLAVPLFHCFGITVSLMTSIIGGMSISLLEKYKTINVCQTIQEDGCTILNGVPSMFLALVKNPKMKDYNLSTLKSGIIAGSPIFEDEYREICYKLPNIKLQTSYGLTEASPCVSIARYDDTVRLKSISSGKIIDNVTVKIVNLETKRECAVGEVGEIYVKGYNVTQGYLSSDPVICDAVQSDGWLKTGDLAYIDNKNYLYIVGRRKNLIIRGGENISPNEIEKFIKEAKKGVEVFVFGKKSEVLQEEIVACIQGKNNPGLEKEIREYLEENISKYKIPKYFVFIDEFPKNSTGKINEKVLKEKVNIKLEGIDCKVSQIS